MKRKATYKELEQKIIELENELAESKSLKQTLSMLKVAVDHSFDGIAVSDMNGVVQFVNPSWAKMHGYTEAELIGKKIDTFHTKEQLLKEVFPFFETSMGQSICSTEMGHIRKDGTVFPQAMIVVAGIQFNTGSTGGTDGTIQKK